MAIQELEDAFSGDGPLKEMELSYGILEGIITVDEAAEYTGRAKDGFVKWIADQFDQLPWEWLEEVKSLNRKRDYQKYLKSAHWQTVRKAALKRAGYRCQICNAKKPLQVHHRTYENLGHELAADVIAICDSCHGIFHKHGKVQK